MMKKSIFIIAFLLGASFLLKAQIEPNYSFYNLQQSIVNPAAAASYDQVYGAAIFNTQMVGFDGAPVTGLIDFGLPVNKANLTIGGQVMYEEIGAHKRTNAGVQIAYRARLGLNNYLTFGVTPFAQFEETNYTQLRIVDDGDIQVGENSFSNVTPNFKFGTFYFSNNFYTGLSVHNVLSQSLKEGNSKMDLNIKDLHFYYDIGYSWEFSPSWAFQPSVMLRLQGHAPIQLDVNAQLLYKETFGFGLSYRSMNTIVAQINYTYNNLLRFGYAFNYGFGQQGRATNFVGHEIFVGFIIPHKRIPYKNAIKIKVPRF